MAISVGTTSSEVDFMPVGDGEKSGDAIALRFTHPHTGAWVVGIIDGGFQDDGPILVEHVRTYYQTDRVDFVLSTHPDGDHIGGLGTVMRELDVGALMIHRPAQHGYPNNSGSKPAEELVDLALAQGAQVIEPFAGVTGFGGALLIAGPTEDYYEQMLAEQEQTTKAEAKSFSARLSEAAMNLVQRALDHFPEEFFFDDAGGTNPRNNSATVMDLLLDDKRLLFTSDVGVPALNQALDYLDEVGRSVHPLRLFQLPHHGSRHNLDLDTIGRVLGEPTQVERGNAIASHSKLSPRYPAPRIANAAGRRGYLVHTNRDGKLCMYDNTPARFGWGLSTPLPPLPEDED